MNEKFSRKICNTRFIFYSNLHIFNTQFNCSTSDIDDTEFIIYCLNLKFEQEIKKFLS